MKKHYVPTSGGGLDANLVAALMNNNNKSLDPANATSVKDGDTEIYLRRDDLETKLKSQVDSYRIMFESVNKQKQLYEKYNDLFQSVKGNSQENVTEEKYKELIARIAELEEQLKEKEQPKE